MNPFSNNRNAMMHQQSYSAEPYREGMDFTDEAWAYGLRALPGSLANQLQALGEYTTGKDYPNKLGNYLDELTQVNEMGYTPQTEYEQAVAFLPELVYDPALIAGAPYAAYKGIRNAPKLLNTLSDDMLTTPMRNQIGAVGAKSQLGAVDTPRDLYHATNNNPFESFDPNLIGSSTDYGALGKGFYFSTDKSVRGDKANMALASADLKNPLILKMPDWKTEKGRLLEKEFGLKLTKYDENWADEVNKKLLENGYDGVILDYSPAGYNHQEVMVIDPSSININKWE